MAGYSVLWVDDHIEQYKPFTQELGRRGIHVYGASSIYEAIRKFSSSGNIDLVLLDLRLKDESGFDFLKRIQTRTNLPICILSSYLHLEEYQKRISRIRKNVGVMDKNLPDPKDPSFDSFVSKIRYLVENPPKYTPRQSNEKLSSNFLSKDPFEITFSEYVNLPSKIKRSIRNEARKLAAETLAEEFQSGKSWVLLCADPNKPVKSLEDTETIPTSGEVTSIAMELDRVPFQFSAPDTIDDIATDDSAAQGNCVGPDRLSSYPTVTLRVAGEQLDVHFDTGSPWTFASFEDLNELGVLSPSLIETDGSRGIRTYEYFSETIWIDLVNQRNGRVKRLGLSVRAVKDWSRSPFAIKCPSSCANKGKLCAKRRALVGRNLIVDHELEITLCGKTRQSTFRKSSAKGTK
ncbi:response regulator [Shimia sp. R9_3]|uniref:response regulator n=1 Tax=Shimia sp. R9_3 TaxID=2821113 RepID=UPI001ADD1CAD|nr:response regulator [Shimia sp. R9_3]MBO9403439.1 response regulator [Shimia sp. R9_3]